jgi:hypothetical protein
MPICTSCGVIRGERAASCERCGAAHRAEALTIPTDSLDIWTSVTCTFKCRLCAFVVPLNAVHTEGQVVCPRCSLTQGFDVNAWSPALEFARDVGDGMSQGRHGGTVAHYTVSSDNTLALAASQGHPLCDGCHAPLVVETNAGGKSVVKCTSCTTTASYAVSGEALKQSRGALRLVITPSHRTDMPTLVEQAATEALSVTCPTCSAPLTPTPDAKIIVCKYCNTTSRVPASVLWKMHGTPPAPDPMWLLFRGPSNARSQADHAKDEETRKGLVHQIEEARDMWRRRAEVGRAESEAQRDAAALAETEAEESAAKAANAKRATNVLLLTFGGIVLVAAASVAIWQIWFPDAVPTQSTSTPASQPKPKPSHH